jgi:hypothetical protein
VLYFARYDLDVFSIQNHTAQNIDVYFNVRMIDNQHFNVFSLIINEIIFLIPNS